ncbi:unnamed protein product [Ilex paraguariensis]|uniref:J domain-containing protein n=1 Tax=Ilex paraguariensis TaxID=185542 RepID=A0ABC8SCT3_9AQUA
MEPTKEEALRAKENAEKLFAVKNFAGAKDYALKAQKLCPELEGISQMVATFEIYTASEVKINGEIDFYSILGLKPSADKAMLKKQYRKMAVLLHPDKNKTVGADGAFKLVSDAWTLLSDSNKRSTYDLKRNMNLSSGVFQTNLSSVQSAGVTGLDNFSISSASRNKLDTFWTVCTSCHVQYEYLRKYINKRLSCKNCRGVFIAVDTGAAPINGSFPYCAWSNVPDDQYRSHGYGVTYVPTTSVYFTGNGVSGLHSGHGSEYASNASLHWSSFPGAPTGVLDPNGLSTSADLIHLTNGKVQSRKANGKHHMKNAGGDVCSIGYSVYHEPPVLKASRSTKKRKVELGSTCRHGNEETASRTAPEVGVVNGNGIIKQSSQLSTGEILARRCSAATAFDARKLLIDKARTEIRKKLEEMKLASAAAAAAAAVAENNKKAHIEVTQSSEAPKRAGLSDPSLQPELQKTGSVSIVVPDSDFHDFDKDRSEECFKPRQIWALYDEEDGMPRLYCLIREVISAKPFKIHISYLNSKTDGEFGPVNWVDSRFTKGCGNFRAYNSEIVDQVNIFSHLLSREKAGRGGCIRIYPKSGDIWAVYRNWSPDWNRKTPHEVRHQYEMVEVLDDYSEELGVCVTPLIKLDGYKTVYQRNTNKDAIRWIPRREMLRFSHQVPSCYLRGEAMKLPGGCWDLDPAATPDELLQAVTEVQAKEKPSDAENTVGTPGELCQSGTKAEAQENPS